MSDGITLTSTQRSSLLSLQSTTDLYQRTANRLDTGKKVNTASDDAIAYFRSQVLYNRATTLTTIKSNIDQNIQALNTVQTATSSVSTLLQQLKAVVEAAQSEGGTQQESSTIQFKDLANQLAQLVTDSTYEGLNLLTSTNSNLNTQLSDRSAATYSIQGYDLLDFTTGGPLTMFTQATPVFTSKAQVIFSNLISTDLGAGVPGVGVQGFSQLNLAASAGSPIPGNLAGQIFSSAEKRLDNAITQIGSITAAIGTNVGILTTRANFTTAYVSDLQTGGDKLTLADLNPEAANSSALQLRQQLGIQSLSITQQLNQAVLQLLK